MAGTKRSAEAPASRASKAAKTDAKDSPSNAKKGAAKKNGKVPPKSADFKASAMPLHLNITHTPPAISEKPSSGGKSASKGKPSSKNKDKDEETVSVASTDPGFLGSMTLLPTVFNTGSYGWKGNKRIQVEIMNSETGVKEKVQVQMTFNATVLGSKDADKDGAVDADNGKEEEEEAASE
ncbi:hypothetical protein K525DRAFT_267750 [Schizophyllum commune Loenen D]|nr:hypothetical protein K525DRAFT_267750 [Schizophyllum commune Loenen D]